MRPVLLDAGPLVAFVDRREEHHAWAAEAFRTVSLPIVTCDAVLSEACFLIQRLPHAAKVLDDLVRSGRLVNRFDFNVMGTRVFDLMQHYRALPMSYADACLVVMAEELENLPVFTLDRHFQIYRRHGDSPIPLLAPFSV